MPYMSCRILRGGDHLIDDDLESFFYLVYLLPFSYASPSGNKRATLKWPAQLSNRCRGVCERCSYVKAAFWEHHPVVFELSANEHQSQMAKQ